MQSLQFQLVKNSYEVTILNQKFVLKSESDAEFVREVTEYVNQIFSDIQSRAQNVSTQNVAILGALNIAERLLDSEKKSHDLVSRWKSRLERLLGTDS